MSGLCTVDPLTLVCMPGVCTVTFLTIVRMHGVWHLQFTCPHVQGPHAHTPRAEGKGEGVPGVRITISL